MSRVIALFRISFVVFLSLIASQAMAQGRPGDLRLKSATHNSITLEWRGAPDISSYKIQYYESPLGAIRYAGRTSKTSFTILGLSKYTKYVFWVDYSGGFMRLSARTERRPKAVEPEKPKPHVATCPLLPASVSVSGYDRNTHCQQVDGPAVGIPELITQGIIDAVDVWGHINGNLRVCFQNHGTLRFLDAATAPRLVTVLPAEIINGSTCGTIDRAGTVVLLASSTGAVETPPQDTTTDTTVAAEQAAVAVEETSVIEPDRCQLVTTAYLSLRTGPSVSYARILAIPFGSKLIALGQRDGWFLVDYEERRGWISGDYVTPSAACDGLISSTRTYFLQFTAAEEDDSDASDVEAAPLETVPAVTTEPGARILVDCRLTTGDIINLRAEPGTEHSILAEIPNQTPLIATERWGDWFQVEYADQSGWVNIAYVFRRGACG